MIKIEVKTSPNLIELPKDAQWPPYVACHPEKGDNIESICGKHRAWIRYITHKYKTKETGHTPFVSTPEPYLELDIVMREENV